MIHLKTESELAAMRVSGRMVAQVLQRVARAVAPGVTTHELGEIAREMIDGFDARNAFFGYLGFPGQVCVSVNDEVVHGIPGDRRIAMGDIVSVDVGLRYGGFIGDTATTVMVGVTDPATIRLVKATEGALAVGIEACRPGARLSDVSNAVQKYVEKAGCSVVRDFVGHGVGREMHEEPQVPNFGKPGRGPELKPGMTFCLEPMVNAGGHAVKKLDDGWTVVTADGSMSAHCEHMLAITDDGVEVLSRVPDDGE